MLLPFLGDSSSGVNTPTETSCTPEAQPAASNAITPVAKLQQNIWLHMADLLTNATHAAAAAELVVAASWLCASLDKQEHKKCMTHTWLG
jgi:hypothetical protein